MQERARQQRTHGLRVVDRRPPLAEPRTPARRRRVSTMRPVRIRRTPQVITAAVVLELWYDHLKLGVSKRTGKPFSAPTYALYTTLSRQFVGSLPEGAELSAVTGAAITLYLARRRAGAAAPKTLHLIEATLHSWLDWCLDQGYLTSHPMDRQPRIKLTVPPVRRIRADQVEKMLARCNQRSWQGARDYAILLTLWRTGLRASELCDLDLDEYDRKEQVLNVIHGKGDKPRTVGVPADAAASLNHFIVRWRGPDIGPLFPGKMGMRLSYAGLLHLVRRLGAAVGIDHLHPHMFRHGFAVEFLLGGGQLPMLQLLLGHSKIEETARYLRTIQAEEATAAHKHVMNQRR